MLLNRSSVNGAISPLTGCRAHARCMHPTKFEGSKTHVRVEARWSEEESARNNQNQPSLDPERQLTADPLLPCPDLRIHQRSKTPGEIQGAYLRTEITDTSRLHVPQDLNTGGTPRRLREAPTPSPLHSSHQADKSAREDLISNDNHDVFL